MKNLKNTIMKKIYTLLLLTLSIGLFAQAPTFQWAIGGIGAGGDDAPNTIAMDASGNIYTAGRFFGTVDFDPGAGVTNLVANGAGSDVFITKTDVSGNLVWAKRIGGSDQDQAYALKLDASGNVYIAGYFAFVCDFDPGAGVHNLGATNLSYQSFILKLDTNGNYLWSDRVEASNSSGTNSATSTISFATTLALDSSGNVYLSGYFVGLTLFGNTTILVGNAVSDVYIMKYDASGVFSWVKHIGSATSEIASEIATDSSGNVYMIGNFNGTLDLDPSPAVSNVTVTGGFDSFLLKLDASGNFVWAKKTAAGVGDELSRSLKVTDAGDVYVAGNFNTTSDFDPTAATNNIVTVGNYDNFISKYDAAGNYYWTKTFGGTGSDFIGSIALDSQNSIYATGSFNSTVDFNPSPSADYTVPSYGANNDVYVLKLTSDGNFIWVQQLGGSAGGESGTAICIDASNNLLIAGILSASGNYQPFGTTTLATHGSNDIFMVKLQSSFLGTADFVSNEKAFTVYPNPNNGEFTIDLKEEAEVVITNMLGQTILQKKLSLGDNSINLQDKANGIYFVTVNDDSKQTFKMVKQ